MKKLSINFSVKLDVLLETTTVNVVMGGGIVGK